jgi:D-alanine-D-alanine ligase
MPEETSRTDPRDAVRAYRAIDCAGMARVDFFARKGYEPGLPERVEQHPGFTKISMYPKLWEASGLPYSGTGRPPDRTGNGTQGRK